MKRILYISPNIRKEGAVHSLIALSNYVKRKNEYEVLVVIPEHGPIEELLLQYEIPYVIWYFVGSVNYGRGTKLLRGIAKFSINLFQSYGLRRHLKKNGLPISLVHSNTITSDFGYFVSQRIDVPHIWHVREFGKYDFNYDYELGIKHIIRCANKAEKIICVSKSVAAYYKSILNPEKVMAIYNGIKVPESITNLWDEDVFKMIFVGRISEEKNQEMAIRACHKMLNDGLTNFILDLYGDGIDTERIGNLIHELGLDEKVRIMGYCSNIPINEYHVGIICSRCEAFGRVTAEYMANGIPVIGTNTGGTAELIENGQTGIILQDNTVDDLYCAIDKLYHDRNLCRIMGARGYQVAKEKYTENRYCSNVYKEYDEFLK